MVSAPKRIILGITGGIAAYKMPLLIRLLKAEGHEVQVICTEQAKAFVTPLSLATVSGNPVLSTLYNEADGTWSNHVELGLWADLMLIAPATASSMAKMANGQSDNLLLTTYLSARCPVLVSPAMDLDMWMHPATQENVSKLSAHGVKVIPPAEGALASGLSGPGRLPEPAELFEHIQQTLESSSDEGLEDSTQRLSGVKVLITAGPTREAIDPVRYIANPSSGKMGIALAESLAAEGAEVTLVKGPVNLSCTNPEVDEVPVLSAQDMYDAVDRRFADCDVFIAAAAVADYTPANPADQKIKKSSDGGPMSLELVRTKDILKEMGSRKKENQCIVGFALETENEIENALSKLKRKNADFIVLNSLRDKGAGFKGDTNKIRIIRSESDIREYPLKSKKEVAQDIVDELVVSLNAKELV
jgi:phosphopantothenoylcysteine decarboxylase/phosphopantothenate--cysteine ligase